MVPESGTGFRIHGCTDLYSYSAGWLDEDASAIFTLCACLFPGASDRTRVDGPAVLMAWADDGLPEKRYLP